MALRQLDYMTRRWTGLARTSRRLRRLPPILPIIVSHARPRWRAPRRFRELYSAPPEIRTLDGLLDFTIVVDDLTATSEEAIAETNTSELLTAVLWSLKSRGQVPEERGPVWRRTRS